MNMDFQQLQMLWVNALNEVLSFQMDDHSLKALSFQTYDSIRRIEVYKTYKKRAEYADSKNLPYHFNTNPLVLAQRPSISKLSKLWFLYLATYFGKSRASNWVLFKRSAFSESMELILVEEILRNRNLYFTELQKNDFFLGSQFSNHRKYSKKSLLGDKGFIHSANYFLDQIGQFNFSESTNFDIAYNRAQKIPLFGRMASFDYICSLCKCNLQVDQPTSMYLKYSTGPQSGFKYLLKLYGLESPDKEVVIQTGDEILEWFRENTEIYLVAQVLEDAICNWQKEPQAQIRYFG